MKFGLTFFFNINSKKMRRKILLAQNCESLTSQLINSHVSNGIFGAGSRLLSRELSDLLICNNNMVKVAHTPCGRATINANEWQGLTEAGTTFDFCLPAISGNCRLSKAIQLSEISMPIGHNFPKESKRHEHKHRNFLTHTHTYMAKGAWQAGNMYKHTHRHRHKHILIGPRGKTTPTCLQALSGAPLNVMAGLENMAIGQPGDKVSNVAWHLK